LQTTHTAAYTHTRKECKGCLRERARTIFASSSFSDELGTPLQPPVHAALVGPACRTFDLAKCQHRSWPASSRKRPFCLSMQRKLVAGMRHRLLLAAQLIVQSYLQMRSQMRHSAVWSPGVPAHEHPAKSTQIREALQFRTPRNNGISLRTIIKIKIQVYCLVRPVRAFRVAGRCMGSA
jgi:hypothetical protein